MSPIPVSAPEETPYIPPPGGIHRAVCVDVVDKGMTQTNFGPKDQVKVRWQLSITDAAGKPYTAVKVYNKSLGRKSNLRKDLVSWRTRDFTADELRGFDLEKLLGANCQLNIVHNQGMRDGEQVTYANVDAVLPPDPNQPRLAALEYTREKDRDQSADGSGYAGGSPQESVEDPAWLSDDSEDEKEPEITMEF